MDPPFSGFVLDPSKCSMLSVEEKRELVRELSKWPESAPEKLQTWSRRDLLEILCAEIGKERKYTSLTKQKMIEYILKVVSDKKSGEQAKDRDSTRVSSTPSPQTPSKRQRKNEHPSHLPIVTNNFQSQDVEEALENIRYCQNSACRATLKIEDAFCKRCSCCICHKYDDNKDPSLWLFCATETITQGDSCGLSCHLECALKNEKTGIMKSAQRTRLDGSYCCTYCGKVNDLLGCWKKQLMIAKDARRVDVLSHRISLSHKLLSLTEKYHCLHKIVDTARKKLEDEVGPTDDFSNMARGIVNRLSVGAEVQKLCAQAVELLDSMRSSASSANSLVQQICSVSSSFINFEQISPTSLTVALDLEDNKLSQVIAGFNLWYRKADTPEYPKKPSFSLFKSKRKQLVTELVPNTEYMFKVVAFSNMRELDMWEVGVKMETISLDNSVGLGTESTVSKSHCQSPKTNSSLSNPLEGDESNTNSTACADLNKLPEIDFDDCEKYDFLETEKSPDHAEKDTGHQKSDCKSSVSGAEVVEPQESHGHSHSALDEEPNSTIRAESTNSMENNQASDIPKSENESNNPAVNEMAVVPFRQSDSALPATPCMVETGIGGSERCNKRKPGVNIFENGSRKPDSEPGSSSKKRCGGNFDGLNAKDGSLEGAYEYCVKMIRWLECEGHIESNFRVKFLTWFSLRATFQERRIVSVYVDTLIDDPPSLAGQLMDTFSEAICSKRPPPVPNGFCSKLWH
ncbi:protein VERNALIZATION INSENSITIVE 3 isoform X1 [Canna indica]|uniref:Protein VERNALIZATION INSENSITIVE 3 isoform X1 n=1 Tax=Canna indica TaxID=4628 RepID=A0AAQ3QEJ3_9LILI|nr:protein VERNALIZATION INSENSITIVE 3 isoform X1 [Canna indica]